MVISREQLYSEVWAEPMLKVALRYDVSSSYLARVCTALNVPRPSRGYWARHAVGRPPPQPPLPDLRPGDSPEWTPGVDPGGAIRAVDIIEQRSGNGTTAVTRTAGGDSLLRSAKQDFEKVRTTPAGYLRPYKQLVSDIFVTKPQLDRALKLARELYEFLEQRGIPVMLASRDESLGRKDVDHRKDPEKKRPQSYGYYQDPESWSPLRPTVAYVGKLAIGLTIFELSERVEFRHINGKKVRVGSEEDRPPRRYSYRYSDWTFHEDTPSGALCVRAYSPYPGTSWSRQWVEAKDGDFSTRLSSIARTLKESVAEIEEQKVEAERAEQERIRRANEEREEYWRREKERARTQARKESPERLLRIIESWAFVERVETFFNRVAARATTLEPAQRELVLKRVAIGREMLLRDDPVERFLNWKAPGEF